MYFRNHKGERGWSVMTTGMLHSARAQARVWVVEIRPLFLVGSVVLAFLGISVAWSYGSINASHAAVAFIGLILWHVSVQVINDYYDYKSGIDLKTQRTPFSGGSGVLPAGVVTPGFVLRLGLVSFFLAVPIWIYFVMDEGVLLLPVLGMGAISVLLYTPVLTRWMGAEVFCGLGLGLLPILMFYFTQTGGYATGAIVAAAASGILMFSIHLLYQIPDVEADRAGGRRTLSVILGRRKAGWVYVTGIVAFYVWVVSWVVAGTMPTAALLSFIPVPLALVAAIGTFRYRNAASFTPWLWVGAIAYVLTVALLASAYIIGGH